MKRLLNIMVFICLSVMAFAQDDTHVVDSLRSVLATQEGREKVKTMIELTWDFYDVSFDDCIDWGEKAIKEAQNQGFDDLEAKANYVLGIQYAYHGDLDLAEHYLQIAYAKFMVLGDVKNAFESLWNIATYELTLGSLDTALKVYEDALPLARQMNDTLAWADVLSNMGAIAYDHGESEDAYNFYMEAKRLYGQIGAEQRMARMDYSLAVISAEKGYWEQARNIYWKILSGFEKTDEEYYAFLTCKNLGKLYENGIVNYDSAMYYFQKAIRITEGAMTIKEYEVFANNEKSGVLVEMANIMVQHGEYAQAIDHYKMALHMAEKCSYYSGQMEACAGLVKVYGMTGQSELSLQYYKRFAELEQRSGITIMRPALTRYMLLTYARLHLYDELDAELEKMEENKISLLRENADVYEQNRNLIRNSEELLRQYESQSTELEALQFQRNHYRLAFFGLLALVFATLVLLVACTIVLKNKEKMGKG